MRDIIDAHLDIAWNAVSFDRDQTLEIEEIRKNEAVLSGSSRGNNTVSLPELRHASIRVCLATLLCRSLPSELPDMDPNIGEIGQRKHEGDILREDLDYANPLHACAAAQGQLAYYRLLEQMDKLSMIRWREDLASFWDQPKAWPGFILSMEGCDPIMEPAQAEWWFEQGLRTACLAHYGPSTYAMGTGGDGPLTNAGKELLKEFNRLGLLLDLVHTADTAFKQALEIYEGAVFISHGNCRTLVPHDRQISDEQIGTVAARGGVIGVVLDEWMLVPDYFRGDPQRTRATLDNVADHIDHICSITGSTACVGIGSDLDGGFGTEQTPTDLDRISDLQKLGDILNRRGYTEDVIDGIFHGNWLQFFLKNLPSRHQ